MSVKTNSWINTFPLQLSFLYTYTYKQTLYKNMRKEQTKNKLILDVEEANKKKLNGKK